MLDRNRYMPLYCQLEEEILRQANAAADHYLQTQLEKQPLLLRRLLWTLLGAAATGAVWLLTVLL